MRLVLIASLLVLAGCGGSPMGVETRSPVDQAQEMEKQKALVRSRACGRHAGRCDPGEGAGSQ